MANQARYKAYTVGEKVSRVFLYLIIIALAVFTSLPLIYVIMTAFKPLNEIVRFPPEFIVRQPTTANFSDLLVSMDSTAVPFVRNIFNSFFICIATVVVTVLICSMGSYGLVKHRVPGGKFLFAVIVAALMFSPQVTQISTYLVVNKLHMVNTYWALILPKVATAFYFFLLKQFVEQLPDAFLEAARIDGASEWHIFWHIVMPFLAPAWATLAVLTFVSNWNDYFTPLIFITDEPLKPLSLVLQTISSDGGAVATLSRAGAMSAATFLTVIPPVLLFIVMQKRVMDTMVYSGIK